MIVKRLYFFKTAIDNPLIHIIFAFIPGRKKKRQLRFLNQLLTKVFFFIGKQE